MVPLMCEVAERCGVSRSCMSQFALMAVTRRYVSIGGRSLPSARIKPALRSFPAHAQTSAKLMPEMAPQFTRALDELGIALVALIARRPRAAWGIKCMTSNYLKVNDFSPEDIYMCLYIELYSCKSITGYSNQYYIRVNNLLMRKNINV